MFGSLLRVQLPAWPSHTLAEGHEGEDLALVPASHWLRRTGGLATIDLPAAYGLASRWIGLPPTGKVRTVTMDIVACFRGMLILVGNGKCRDRRHSVPAAAIKESGEC